MEQLILLAIISFSKGKYAVDHYPAQQAPWIETIEYSQKDVGVVGIEFKNSVFNKPPSCKWTALNSDSSAVGSIIYYSKNKIRLSFFEKVKKKDGPKDLSFILSCKPNR